MKSNLKQIINTTYIKKKIDRYIQRQINEYLKSHLDFKNDSEFRKIFENGYSTLMWENALKRNEEKIIKIFKENIKLYCYIDSILCKFIYTDVFEESELSFIKHYLKKGEVFVDIGANVGLFTVHAAKYVGTPGKIIAFEPSPTTYNRLLENIELNKYSNVETHQLGISGKNEILEMNISQDGFDAWNSFSKPTQGSLLKKQSVSCIQIDRMDEVDSDFYRASLIKMDIEGWELFALKGGEKFFRTENSPTILIEFTDLNAINAGTSCKEVYEYLNYLGYELYEFDEINLKLVHKPLEQQYPYNNLIATKSVKLVNDRLGKLER